MWQSNKTGFYNHFEKRKILIVYSSAGIFQFLSRAPTPSRDQERIASALELRMKDADYEADALREHHERNRGVMSQKMAEMSKLQNTLTNQAKVGEMESC